VELFDAAPTNRIQAEVVRTTIIVQDAYTNVIKQLNIEME